MEALRGKLKSHTWIIPSTLLISLSILLWQTSVRNDFSIIRPLLTWKRTDRNWITVEFDSNFTANLLSELPKMNDTSNPCLSSRTTTITIVGLDDMVRDHPVILVAGEIYYYSILTFDETGNRRCSGGDYIETDLSSENWKSRPPVKDHGDGTYSFSFQIHPDFVGNYNLTIYILFRNYDGFIFPSDTLAYNKEMRRIPITFENRGKDVIATLPTLPLCQLKDFTRDVWTGRWTRHVWNNECNISVYDGRYRCIDQCVQCVNPWCQGQVGLLESNGWSYSAHCSFHIYTQDEAWRCLNGKYLFFWGDSNHRDSIRNLLDFVLGRWEVDDVPRRIFNVTYVNPRKSYESVRITSIYNGHFDEGSNFLGLDSLLNEGFQGLIKRHFTGEDNPDVVILNTGLHDGVHGYNISGFANAADYAVDFWGDIFQSLKEKNDTKFPAIFYRTTVAAGGHTRLEGVNPQKMEAYNNIMVEKIKRKGFLNNHGSGFVDDFDMTFPFHYDLRHNDGMHYGRPATKEKWLDGKVGHHYFVDLMLVHVLLNAICHDQQQQW